MISVAMTSFNGENFIKEQIESILACLKINDELIISDDGSKDNTINIINSFNDSRIKLINGPKQGVVKNFENAINNCSGDYIFLSDQDDIWLSNKIEKVISCFNNTNCDLVLHNASIYDNNTKKVIGTTLDKIGYRKSFFGNMIKNSFIGCSMAFKKELLKYILPFPSENEITIHDWWIGLNAIKYGKVAYINDTLINYRIHDKNTLGFNKTTLWFKITKRSRMRKAFKKHIKEIKKNKMEV